MRLIQTTTGRTVQRGMGIDHGDERLVVTRVDEPNPHMPHGRIWVMHRGRGPASEHVRFPYNFEGLEWTPEM